MSGERIVEVNLDPLYDALNVTVQDIIEIVKKKIQNREQGYEEYSEIHYVIETTDVEGYIVDGYDCNPACVQESLKEFEKKAKKIVKIHEYDTATIYLF